MTAILPDAERARLASDARGPAGAPDPAAVFTFHCQRCGELMSSTGISRECVGCAAAAGAVWPGILPIAGDLSGG
ncbi:hypothetical protein 32HC_66 [Mycobacterium phage 32HC]|uniref:Uncharacterized protein n=1 Tax=Mycobacterium phage 32HC TaxID=1445729 RepID=W8E8V1_9CAUD|nr:hypothetical protein ST32HC_66 [Mycobacterium phage 32HC]AHJ86344.1 hypothetical protein 32HC_66 [Mycobacterium phage 32HC]